MIFGSENIFSNIANSGRKEPWLPPIDFSSNEPRFKKIVEYYPNIYNKNGYNSCHSSTVILENLFYYQYMLIVK